MDLTDTKIASQGEKFSCTDCGNRLFELTKDLHIGMDVTVDLFSFVPGQKVTTGQETQCQICGYYWFDGSRIDARPIHGEIWN